MHGTFVWYDVMTTDTRAAEAFYTNVVGWTAQDSGTPSMDYTLFSAGGTMIGGLMPIPDDLRNAGASPCWTGYVAVADVDDSTAKAQQAGGVIHRPPTDIPGVGRFAVVADPQGATIILFKGATGAMPAGLPPMSPGHVGWHELSAADAETAFGFYATLFGWTKADAMDMGPLGTYQMFSTGGPPVGGMMTEPPGVAAPFWLYYFVVAAIDAAAARVTAGGGQVLRGPQEVPGGAWIIQCRDPQGAMFALVAAHR
jgi:predicted enzyme related to lactoylglutathione lyase